MRANKYILIFSYLFPIVIAILNIIDISFDKVISQFTLLTPVLVLNNNEFWRIITYPFALSTIPALFLFIIAFVVYFKRVVYIFSPKYLPLLFLIIVSLYGMLYTVVFMNSNQATSGFEAVSFFMIFFYSLYNPKAEINLFDFTKVKVKYLTLFTITLWGLMNIAYINLYGYSYIMPAITALLTGLTIALTLYIPLKTTINKVRKRINSNIDNITIPRPDELTHAIISEQKIKKSAYKDMLPSYEENNFLSDDMKKNDVQLDIILDKINQYGKESLSIEETFFLNEYSKIIDD